MNIIDEIKALWSARGVANDIIKEAKMDTASGKPGWKTTEFWLNAAAQLGTLWASVKGFVPPQTATIISIVGVAIYTVARTIAKAVSDVQTAKTATAVVTTNAPAA